MPEKKTCQYYRPPAPRCGLYQEELRDNKNGTDGNVCINKIPNTQETCSALITDHPHRPPVSLGFWIWLKLHNCCSK